MKHLALIFMAIPVAALHLSHPACAGLIELTTRPATGDTIDWAQIAPPLPSMFATPANFTSASGITGMAALANNGTGEVFEQCCVGVTGSVFANFAPGDIIFATVSSGPLTLSFDTPLSIVGTQIAANTYGPFTAQIQAFHHQTLLGSFTEDGVTTTSADNSAIFLGVADTNKDITSIVFSLTSAQGELTDFLINDVTIQPRRIPEPSSLVFLCTGLIGLVAWWMNTRGRDKWARPIPRSARPIS